MRVWPIWVVLVAGSACSNTAPAARSVAPATERAPSATGSVAPEAGSVAPTPDRRGYIRPDPSLTPGDVLTTDRTVVCVPGYSKTVRNVPVAEKQAVDRAYGWMYRPGAQEYDHLIPLSIGGSNDRRNIWPQPIEQAQVKDRLEAYLHREVCDGRMPLTDAQRAIATDWAAAWVRAGKP